MYLSRIFVENFRIFGAKTDGKSLELQLQPGLNLVVGENDSGKSALLDAVRLVMGTQSSDSYRITSEDFHLSQSGRAKDMKIRCRFSGLSKQEASALLEWLKVDGLTGTYTLDLTLEAKRKDLDDIRSSTDREVLVWVRAGVEDAEVVMDTLARDNLRVTYLKALRDAEQELAAKRGSRLSQILLAHPLMKQQGKASQPPINEEPGTQPPTSPGGEPDPDNSNPLSAEKTLFDIVQEANQSITNHAAIKTTVDDLNNRFLQEFLLANDNVRGSVSIADPELRRILEQLQLALADEEPGRAATRHGLGMNNLLFMATELLLLNSGKSGTLPLALIEEPEAHLHPQFQGRLVEVLEANNEAQIIMTTHSPNLASQVNLQRLIYMSRGQAFPLGSEFTKLERSDYEFLRRFLDVTKSNLFFARGVVMVEGDAEAILLPTIAELTGKSFSRYGVSTVNVGHVGFFRYARIFQRRQGPEMSVRVACLGDRDIPPDQARPILRKTSKGNDRPTESDFTPESTAAHVEAKKARSQGGPVRTFVSPVWTLEYDLAASGLELEIKTAVNMAMGAGQGGYDFDQDAITYARQRASAEIAQWRASGKSDEEVWVSVYEPLYSKQASKTEVAQVLAIILRAEYQGKPDVLRSRLPDYLREAIDYVAPPATNARPSDLVDTGGVTSAN